MSKRDKYVNAELLRTTQESFEKMVDDFHADAAFILARPEIVPLLKRCEDCVEYPPIVEGSEAGEPTLCLGCDRFDSHTDECPGKLKDDLRNIISRLEDVSQ